MYVSRLPCLSFVSSVLLADSVLPDFLAVYFIYRNRQKKAQWKALDADEKLAYAREVAPKIGNKSLLFEFKS